MSRREIIRVIIGMVLGGVFRNIGRKAPALGGFSFGAQWSYGPDDGKSLFAWQIIEKCRREEWTD